jgi:hypothetical protein
MTDKTITYETAAGTETTAIEELEYEPDLGIWRFEVETDAGSEIVRVPRERIYEIRQRQVEHERAGRDQYGHP